MNCTRTTAHILLELIAGIISAIVGEASAFTEILRHGVFLESPRPVVTVTWTKGRQTRILLLVASEALSES